MSCPTPPSPSPSPFGVTKYPEGNFNTSDLVPSSSPTQERVRIENPSPRKFKAGPITDFDDEEIAADASHTQTKAHKDASKMLLGYGTVQFGTMALQHGAIAARDISPFALGRLKQSFQDHGVLRYSNPINLLVEKEDFVSDRPLADTLDGDIPSVTFVPPAGGGLATVLCIAGQHREALVLERVQELQGELQAKSAEKERDTDAIETLEARIEAERTWAAAFYCKGSVLDSSSSDATAVASLLSSNQRLWQWEARPFELWQLALRWISRFGTDKKMLLRAIGETRKYPWLKGLVVRADWRDVISKLIVYPGVDRDNLLKTCGNWCIQPHSKLAHLTLKNVARLMGSVSTSASSNHHPEIWTKELADFLLGRWRSVGTTVEGLAGDERQKVVDAYHVAMAEQLSQHWQVHVTSEDTDPAPSIEEILQIIEGSSVAVVDPILLSWEGLKKDLDGWKPCADGLNELSRWLDPAMGEYHHRSTSSLRLSTATEYIWHDLPPLEGAKASDEEEAFVSFFWGMRDDLRNMSLAVAEIRGDFVAEITEADEDEIAKMARARSAPTGQRRTKDDEPSRAFSQRVEIIMANSAILPGHLNRRNRVPLWKRFITAIIKESTLQQMYMPRLMRQASAYRVRLALAELYQNRNPRLSVYWNDYGGQAMKSPERINDSLSYKTQMQFSERQTVLRQVAAPYRRLVSTGAIPKGLARDGMTAVLAIINQHLGGVVDADGGDGDIGDLRNLLGTVESDDEYVPTSGSESETGIRKKKATAKRTNQKQATQLSKSGETNQAEIGNPSAVSTTKPPQGVARHVLAEAAQPKSVPTSKKAALTADRRGSGRDDLQKRQQDRLRSDKKALAEVPPTSKRPDNTAKSQRSVLQITSDGLESLATSAVKGDSLELQANGEGFRLSGGVRDAIDKIPALNLQSTAASGDDNRRSSDDEIFTLQAPHREAWTSAEPNRMALSPPPPDVADNAASVQNSSYNKGKRRAVSGKVSKVSTSAIPSRSLHTQSGPTAHSIPTTNDDDSEAEVAVASRTRNAPSAAKCPATQLETSTQKGGRGSRIAPSNTQPENPWRRPGIARPAQTSAPLTKRGVSNPFSAIQAADRGDVFTGSSSRVSRTAVVRKRGEDQDDDDDEDDEPEEMTPMPAGKRFKASGKASVSFMSNRAL